MLPSPPTTTGIQVTTKTLNHTPVSNEGNITPTLGPYTVHIYSFCYLSGYHRYDRYVENDCRYGQFSSFNQFNIFLRNGLDISNLVIEKKILLILIQGLKKFFKKCTYYQEPSDNKQFVVKNQTKTYKT